MNEITQPAAREYEWSGVEGKRRKKVVFVDWFIASNDILKYEKRSFSCCSSHFNASVSWESLRVIRSDVASMVELAAFRRFEEALHWILLKLSSCPHSTCKPAPNFSEKLNEIKVSVCVAEKLNNNYSMPQWSWNSLLHEWKPRWTSSWAD